MKFVLVWVIIGTSIFAAKLTELKWAEHQTFAQYLKENNISLDMLGNMTKDDQKFIEDINFKHTIYELKTKKGTLLQTLIPISKVMQIHLSKVRNSNKYNFDIIPIEYETGEYFARVKIGNHPYTDILNTIHNQKATKRLTLALKNVVDLKNLNKGDEVDFIYKQDTRMGKPYLMSEIKIVRLLMGNKEKFLYIDEDGHGYGQMDRSIPYKVNKKRKINYTKHVAVSNEEARFDMPLRNIRITSSFSYSRYHPILKRNRPHHGTDFGARKGTPLLAVNAGKVSFSGWMGGYGNVIKIRHGGGYESLYAHQSRRRAKVGDRVAKGDVVGYVGSTGRSTGPHLHFGLKRHGKWIDPMKVLRKKSIKSSVLKDFSKYQDVVTTKYQIVKIDGAKENKTKLISYIQNNTPTYVWDE